MTRILQRILLVLPLAAFAAVPREKLGFDPTGDVSRVASAYIAPYNMILYRMRYPDGSYREFEHNFDSPNILRSVGKWRGRIKDDRITVKTGPNVEGGPAEFVFKTGRLISFSQGDKTVKFPYRTLREVAGSTNTPPYWFGDELVAIRPTKAKGAAKRPKAVMDSQVRKVFAGKWKKSGRLRWPYSNPNENGCLYASLALLACALFYSRRRVVQIAGGALFLCFVSCLVMTASRGSFLALALGLLPMGTLRFRSLVRSKAFWALATCALVVAAVWFLSHDTRLLTRGFGEASWSNKVRLDMWRAVPQMIAEAPGGWKFAHVGRAYMDWYQPLEIVSLPGSLMNDHLTWVVGWGWIGRFLYLFAWLAALGLLGLAAWRTKKAVGLGALVLFAVASWFNPVLWRVSLWCAPVASVGLCLADRPWRGCRWRWVAYALGGAALVAMLALGGIWLVGAGSQSRGYPVRASQNRVYVKGMNPQTWIVDDGKTLGGVLACKEIRGYYRYLPNTPSLGYVRNVQDLPEKVRRLVLAGQAGADWMDWIRERAEKGEPFAIPEEVLFISPPFPPSALPDGFIKACKVRLVVGEFAAQYEPEYANPPPWVLVVPGMELYIDGWMDLAFVR